MITPQLIAKPSESSKKRVQARNHSATQSATKTPPKNSLKRVTQSVFAGLFGIQSEQKRQDDFEAGQAGDFILAGVVGVVVLLVGMLVLVNLVVG